MNVVDAVRAGRAEYDWVPLDVDRLRLWVFPDALKVAGVRVNVTAEEAQQVADLIGGCLTTPKIEDLIWQRAAVRIPPFPGDVTKRTAEQHSADIDRAIAGRPGMVATVGKSWCLSNKLSGAVALNYGWHGGASGLSVSLPGVRVWQTPGTRHNARHRDYSQTLRLVRRRCLVDGLEADLRDVLSDAVLAPLVSHEGPLRVLRQPGAPELEAADTVPPPAPVVHADGEVIVLPEITIYGSPPVPKPAPATPPSRTPSGTIAALAGDEPGVTYVPARHYRAGRKQPPIWVVIHTAEVGEVPTAATALQKYAATMKDGRVASWHYAVSNTEITQSVRERDTAYHAKQANARGVGVELCQRANQSVAQWDDAYSRAVLLLGSELCARIAQRWSIPLVHLTPEQLLAGESGFAGHVDFTRAHKVKGGHTDPGPHFPWADFLERVRRAHEQRF